MAERNEPARIIPFPALVTTIAGRAAVARGITDFLGWTDAAERGYKGLSMMLAEKPRGSDAQPAQIRPLAHFVGPRARGHELRRQDENREIVGLA